MKTGRKILISTILSLSAAGAIAPAVAAAVPASAGVVAVSYSPDTHFYV